MASKRSREMMGATLRGEVRKAMALKSSVESKTLRLLRISASPNRGSIKNFCAICQLAHSRGCAGAFGRDFICCAGLLIRWDAEKALGERKAHFIGIGGDVGGVHQQHILSLLADAGNVAVSDLRLDGVAQLPVPAGDREIALQDRCPQIDGGFKIEAVERVVADGGNPAVGVFPVRCLADRVRSLAQRRLGQHTPAAAGER